MKITKNELQLRRLIYGQSNIIIVNGKPKDMLEQIELIKSSMSIDGFIFRPHFADTENLTAYTDEDWMAIIAQYSLTYGWSNTFQHLSGKDATQVLDEYFSINNEPKVQRENETSPDIYFQVEPVSHYTKVMKDIATSKTVLRKQQIEILKLMPIKLIEQTYKSTKITIKETEVLVIKRLLDSGSDSFHFKNPDQILRFTVNAFNLSEPVEGQLTKTILKSIKLRIPTKYKKKILNDINLISKKDQIKTTKNMYKYLQFWKRLYKQLAYASLGKMADRFPNAFLIRKYLYSNNLAKSNTELETYKSEGNYKNAFFEEMKNPGQMLRNLLQYMRYKNGDYIAKKRNQNSEPYSVASHFELNNQLRRKVHVDAFDILASTQFYDTLLKTNTKLLWQVLTLIRDERLLEPVSKKTMNKTKIAYEIPLPGLYPEAITIVKKQLKNAIKQIKREQNSSLGNVYIDKSVKDYAVQFSGRTDTSISMSGEYMPSGTIKDLTDVIKGKNKLLRVGLAWKGKTSCDIDLSMNLDNHNAIYYGNPQLRNNSNEIIISSSGDITSNGNEIFSTELIDVDLDLLKQEDIKWMFNSAIMFSGSTFDQYEAYWFMSIIDKKDRVIDKRQIKIKLDEMDYATQITEPERGMMGLYFTFDKKAKVEVINIPIRLGSGSNAERAKQAFDNVMANKPKTLTIGKALKMSINKQQLVDDIEFADLVISHTEPDTMKEGSKFLHPGKDNAQIQELIF